MVPRPALRALVSATLLGAAIAFVFLTQSGTASASLDPTGTWSVTISGDINASCTSDFSLAGAALSADWTCGTFGSGTLSGTLTKNASGATFHVSGTIHQGLNDIYFEADGSVVSDGNSMSGTWYAAFDILSGSGTFSGSRQGAPTPAPTQTPTITATQTPLPPTSTPGGPTPTRTPSPTASPTAPGLAGDANCDHNVNSIDAAVTLQYIAGLVQSLACQSSADVNHDGTVNAVDVTLILQYVAGQIAHLPV
jgi:hypothetical protein